MWCRVSACVQCENGVIASPLLLVEGPGDASFTAGDGRMGVEALKVVGPAFARKGLGPSFWPNFFRETEIWA